MCKVIEEMRREEREEGRKEGMENTRTANIAALMKNLSVSVEKAMELLGIPAEERDALAKKIIVSRTGSNGLDSTPTLEKSLLFWGFLWRK